MGGFRKMMFLGVTLVLASGSARVCTATEPAPPDVPPSAETYTHTWVSRLMDGLMHEWRPHCGPRVPFAKLKVKFVLDAKGRLAGGPELSDLEPVTEDTQVAAKAAIEAVVKAAPFPNPPPSIVGKRIAVNFNSQDVCGG